MITLEEIEKLTTKFQVPQINVVREYFQHLFLSYLYKLEGAENILFKGGTALRIIYGSPRFSEDLDFSSFNIEPRVFKEFIEDRFQDTLVAIERIGIKVNLGSKSRPTTEGYYGVATFPLYGLQVDVEINVSQRNTRLIKGEVETITSDFVPTYNLYHLPKKLLVEEKIDALFERGKPRDFYDLYFMLRRSLVEVEQKESLLKARELVERTGIDDFFKSELKALLPRDQHQIIEELKARLLDELTRQIGGGPSLT